MEVPIHSGVFFGACRKGRLLIVKLCIESKQFYVDHQDRAGCTGLMYASEEGKTEVVKFLLEKGADPNFCDSDDKRSPLKRASWNGYKGIVELLLEYGAKVDQKDIHGETPLHSAAHAHYRNNAGRDYIGIINMLIENKADVNSRNKFDMTILMTASVRGYTNIIKVLQENGADINKQKKSNGFTALMFACWNDHLDTVKLLLKNGADFSHKNTRRKTVLGACCTDIKVYSFLSSWISKCVFLCNLFGFEKRGRDWEKYKRKKTKMAPLHRSFLLNKYFDYNILGEIFKFLEPENKKVTII